mgnify:CR=1 FL=1
MKRLLVPVDVHTTLVYRVRAWTGGDAPQPGNLIPLYRRIFESIRCQLYREQWAVHVEYWYEAPGPDVRQTFWNRATHDAWRTLDL